MHYSCFSDQIWQYKIDYYFIQVSSCEWVQVVNGDYWATFRFVKIKDDPVEGQVLCLSRKNWYMELFENKALVYKDNGVGSKQFHELWKQPSISWRFPSKKCLNLKKSIIL